MSRNVSRLVREELEREQANLAARQQGWRAIQTALGDLLDNLPCTSAAMYTDTSFTIILPPIPDPRSPELQAARALCCKLLALSGQRRVGKYRAHGHMVSTFYLAHPEKPGKTLYVTVMRPHKCKSRTYRVLREEVVTLCEDSMPPGVISLTEVESDYPEMGEAL